LSGKYLNDSQCTPVKPVQVQNVYDFPFRVGAKKKGLTPRTIDASENKLKPVLLRTLIRPSCVFDSRDPTLWQAPAAAGPAAAGPGPGQQPEARQQARQHAARPTALRPGPAGGNTAAERGAPAGRRAAGPAAHNVVEVIPKTQPEDRPTIAC
jgi:hypothetical protein